MADGVGRTRENYMSARNQLIVGALLAGFVVVGCSSGHVDHRGRPSGTVPFEVHIDTSDPGSRIEVDGEDAGISPLTVTIWGDKDGTFHGSGDGYTEFKAYPVKPGQYIQTKRYLNGAQAFMFGQQDQIPRRLYFDLNQKPEGLQIIAPQ